MSGSKTMRLLSIDSLILADLQRREAEASKAGDSVSKQRAMQPGVKNQVGQQKNRVVQAEAIAARPAKRA